MRLYLSTTPNIGIVSFNYQKLLTGVVHKWFGKGNDEHGDISLYSFSWLGKAELARNGLMFPHGAEWFISIYDEELFKRTMQGVLKCPEMFEGMIVKDIQLAEEPDLTNREVFRLASPVFVKRTLPDGRDKHFTYDDSEVSEYMTATLRHKMEIASLKVDESLKISFDLSYTNRKIKLMEYDGIQNKANMCPIVIQGRPETKRFAWNVGIGNSTGIGFGSIE